MRKDIVGNSIDIGTEVLVTPKNYRGLVKATVKSFTPTACRVVYQNTWNYGGAGHAEEYLVPTSAVAKIIKEV